MNNPFSIPKDKGLYGIFNDSFPPILDGVSLTVENYAYWLKKYGAPTCVVTPWNPEIIEKPYDVLRYFSLPIRSRSPYRYGYPKLDPFIWYRLRNTNFKIVHAHCPFSSGRLGVYVKKKRGVPLIGTFHSKYKDDLSHSFNNTRWMIPIIMQRIIDFFNLCDEVWIPQAFVEDTVREYGYKGKLTVVENGNDFSSIVQGDLMDYKLRAKKRLNIPEKSIALLFLGQHIWEKGIDVILDTLKELKDSLSFTMNFIGTGYAANDIRNKIIEYGLEDCCTMHGAIRDRKKISDYYAASDLFLFPSFYDNAPLVLREAAAMGTPTMLLEESTASEVIRDGYNGFLVKKNPKEFAKAIMFLQKHKDILKEVSYNARNTLVRSWEDVVGEVLDRYDSIYKNNRQYDSWQIRK